MIRDGITPIPFDAPTTEGCPGKWRPFKSCFNALCHQCQRFGKGGTQIDPAARIQHGGSVCMNLVPMDACHESESAPTCQVLQPPIVRGRTNPTRGGE